MAQHVEPKENVGSGSQNSQPSPLTHPDAKEAGTAFGTGIGKWLGSELGPSGEWAGGVVRRDRRRGRRRAGR